MSKKRIENTPINNAQLDRIAKLEQTAFALGVKLPKRKLKYKIDLSVRIMELLMLNQKARKKEIRAMNADQLRTRYNKLVAKLRSLGDPSVPFPLTSGGQVNTVPNSVLEANMEEAQDNVLFLQDIFDHYDWEA